jgi:hypothetical protein
MLWGAYQCNSGFGVYAFAGKVISIFGQRADDLRAGSLNRAADISPVHGDKIAISWGFCRHALVASTGIAGTAETARTFLFLG